MSLLVVDRIDVFYGRRIQALREVSLDVNEGEVVALFGRNGAGKTTLLRTVSGVLKSRRGQIQFNGGRIDHKRPAQIVAQGLSQVPENRHVFPSLSVLENLRMGGYTVHDRTVMSQRLDEAMELFPILKDRAKQAAGTLSGGEQQMLAIARALMSGPRLLMIDELSLGLAPKVLDRLFEALDVLRRQGLGLLLVEQHIPRALEVADRVFVLRKGRIEHAGDARGVADLESVEMAYLGR